MDRKKAARLNRAIDKRLGDDREVDRVGEIQADMHEYADVAREILSDLVNAESCESIDDIRQNIESALENCKHLFDELKKLNKAI